MKILAVIGVLVWLAVTGCPDGIDSSTCKPDGCVESETEFVIGDGTDMTLQDGKYISPRQMRAVTGD